MPENALSAEEAKIVNQAARTLRILISNAQLYSPKSQLVKDGILNLIKTLDTYLSTRGKINISESEKNLIIDGQVLKTADKSGVAFVENMLQCELRSITLKQGVSEEEIFTLIEQMSIKRKELRGNLEAILKEKGYTHIEVNSKIYVALGDDQQVTQEGSAPITEGVEQGVEGSQGSYGNADYVSGSSRATGGGTYVPVTQSITDQANSAVTGEKKELIKKERRQELQKMLKDLDGINRPDLAGQVVDRIAENLDDSEKNVRLETVRSFKQLNPTIQQLSDKHIINNLEERFISSEERETEEDVYRELADMLEEVANKSAAEGNYEKALQITKMFRMHKFAKNEGFETRAGSADKILGKLANSGLVDILVDDLRSADPRKKEEAYKVVASLDEHAVFYLIDTMKDIEDVHLRRIIGFLIKNLGESAVKLLCESVTPDISTEEALRILEVMDSVEYYDVVFDELKSVYNHYNPDVRRGVLDILAKLKPDRVQELLITAVEDFDPKIIKEAVKLAGKVKSLELVPKLVGMISVENYFSSKKTDPAIEEEVCIALGKIKDNAAIELLVNISTGGNIFRFTKEKPLNVRIAALYALGSFASAETKEVLLKLSGHSDKNISRAAKEALKLQERTGAKKGSTESRRLL